jgi:hypothetical protein
MAADRLVIYTPHNPPAIPKTQRHHEATGPQPTERNSEADTRPRSKPNAGYDLPAITNAPMCDNKPLCGINTALPIYSKNNKFAHQRALKGSLIVQQLDSGEILKPP